MSDRERNERPKDERPQDSSAALRADGGPTMADGRAPENAHEAKDRPVTTRDEVERTGRDAQVTANEGFGAPGSIAEQRTGLDENDPRSEGR